MNSGKREVILGRIREALRVPAPRLHAGHDPLPATPGQREPRSWLPGVPPDAEGRLALFQKNCVQLKTDLRLVTGLEEATKTLINLRDAHQWVAAAAHHHPLLGPIVPALGLETLYTEERPDAKHWKMFGRYYRLRRLDLSDRLDSAHCHAVRAGVPCRSCRRITWSLPEPINWFRTCRRPVTCSQHGTAKIIPALLPSSRVRAGPATSSEFLVLGAHGPKNLTVILIR